MNSIAIFAARFLRIDGRAATYCYFCYSLGETTGRKRCETAGKRSDFFLAEFLYAGFGTPPPGALILPNGHPRPGQPPAFTLH